MRVAVSSISVYRATIGHQRVQQMCQVAEAGRLQGLKMLHGTDMHCVRHSLAGGTGQMMLLSYKLLQSGPW